MKPLLKVRWATVCVVLAMASSWVGCTRKSNDPPGTLHLALIEKIKGMDPAQADDLYAGNMVHLVYESLYQYHYLKRPYQIVPNLAAALPEISADGKTYTIKIKQGVLFQDDASFKASSCKGRELVADDIVYSLKRLADPKTVSSGWWVLEGKIVGLDDWRAASTKAGTTDYSAPVAGLKAVDRYTVQIQLVQRNYQFIYGLAMPFTGIVPREAVEAYGKEFLNHAVGTGPFKLTEYNPAAKLVFAKNPTYRDETYPSEGEAGDQEKGLLADAGKKLPFADKLVYTIYVESQPQWLTFMKGGLDATSIPKDNYAQAVTPTQGLTDEMKKLGVELHRSPSLDVTHETFNMADPVIGKNKLLRQALSTAYDPVPLLELFYNNRAIAAQGPIPPGLAGYDPAFKSPYRQFSVEKAKELLAKAGYPGGKGLAPIDYATVSSSTSRQMNEYFQKQMAAIGVQVKFNTYSWPEFQAAIKNRKGQMWGFAWGADYPDAENFLQLFYSKNTSPGPNDSNYSNPEFDRLYEKSLTLADSPERTALYVKMAQMVVEDCPWIMGVHRLNYGLTQKWLKNYKYHDIQHGIAKYLRVDPALKK